MKKNGVFLYGISFFIFEIFTFLYYANEQIDDVIQYTPEILEQCSSHLAPGKYITTETNLK